jgi:thiol-disulfide isomerase/thioredoxin
MNNRQTFNPIHYLSQFLLVLSFLTLIHLDANADGTKSFVMKDLAGKEHRLSDYQSKWVILNFWATWCPSCLDEMPDFISLYEQRKAKDLVVLGIAVDYKNEREVRHFVDDMLVSYPIILGTPKIFAQFGSPSVLPTTLIYNPQGRLVKIKRGQLSKQAVELIMLSPPNESLDALAPQ